MTVALLVGATGAKAAAEPTPPRLVVGDVVLERENIFARSEVDSATGMGGFLKRLSNRLHATTRPHVLRHEFLFREATRSASTCWTRPSAICAALGILAEVVVAPIDTTADGRVAVRVATRESWTLETDVTFSLDAGGQSRWTVQLADKNFMGYGVTAGAAWATTSRASTGTCGTGSAAWRARA